MADNPKENKGADSPAKTKAATTSQQESEAAAAAAASADKGGAATGLTQADLDKAVADAVAATVASRNAEIDQLKADHVTASEQAAAAAEEKGYKAGVKDGAEAAVPTGSAVYTEAQIEAIKVDASKQGYQDGLDAYEADPDDELALRGALMEILLLIPANLRRIRPEDRLRDMVDFLEVLNPMERNLAIPMIRSIALMEPNDIPNGKYKADVLNALNVAQHGNSLDVIATEDSLDTGKAFARLQSVVAHNAVPAGAAQELEPDEDVLGHAGVMRDANSSEAAGDRLAFLTGGVRRGGGSARFEDSLQPPE